MSQDGKDVGPQDGHNNDGVVYPTISSSSSSGEILLSVGPSQTSATASGPAEDSAWTLDADPHQSERGRYDTDTDLELSTSIGEKMKTFGGEKNSSACVHLEPLGEQFLMRIKAPGGGIIRERQVLVGLRQEISREHILYVYDQDDGTQVGKWCVAPELMFLVGTCDIQFRDGQDSVILKGRNESVRGLGKSILSSLEERDVTTADIGGGVSRAPDPEHESTDTVDQPENFYLDNESVGKASPRDTTGQDWWPQDMSSLESSDSEDDKGRSAGGKKRQKKKTPKQRRRNRSSAASAPGKRKRRDDAASSSDENEDVDADISCPLCDEVFDDSVDVVLHLSSEHQAEEGDLTCPLCGSDEFDDDADFAQHVALHMY